MNISLFLDIIVAILLVATIIYAIILNRHLAIVRNSREELKILFETFSYSLNRAEAGVKSLKSAAEQTGSALGQNVSKGTELQEELKYMLERAEELSSTLERLIREGRDVRIHYTNKQAGVYPIKGEIPSLETNPAKETVEPKIAHDFLEKNVSSSPEILEKEIFQALQKLR